MNKRNLKYLDRYTCEFDFIPNTLTSLYIKGKIDDYIMTHPMEWKKLLPKFGFGYDFGLRNMTVVKSENETKRAKFLITFPKPKVSPDCFYAILYIGKGDYNYYTLELDLGSSTVCTFSATSNEATSERKHLGPYSPQRRVGTKVHLGI